MKSSLDSLGSPCLLSFNALNKTIVNIDIDKESFLNAPFGIVRLSKEGTIIEVNPSLCGLLAFDYNELVGKHVLTLLHSDDVPAGRKCLNQISSALISHFHLEKRCLRKDNSTFLATICASVTHSQEILVYISPIDVDVLAQTACAKQIEIERNKYQAIIEATLDGFWIINLQGEFLECNNAYCKLVGYSREELLKMRIADIEANETEEDIACRISSIISTGHARFLTHHLHKNGTKIPVHISATYLDTDGPTICTFIQDRTESENSFKALQESTKLILEAKQNVISISEQTLREIGQELHDDLGQIITGAAMLAEAISGDANSCGIKCQISGEISRLLKVAVKRIRSISHGLYPVELQNNGLLPMISSLIERINSNFEINISMTVNSKNMHFNETESLHIYRIIQEGINNIVRHSQATQASIIFTKQKTNYLIELSDNGRGLPDSNEILGGHSGISGLGLQSIQFRAKKIGADVFFENQLTGGLSIKLTLPIIS